MNARVALAIVLLTAVCLLNSADAFQWRNRQSSDVVASNVSVSYMRPTNNSGVKIAVRRVDEEHPYFRSFYLRLNTSLSGLQQGFRRFFNQTSNVTWIVKNDRMLITRDIDVRMLSNNDQLEVWFVDSQAPTRSKTLYSFSKGARKASWSSSKSDKDRTADKKKEKKKDKKKSRSSEEESEDSFESFDSF